MERCGASERSDQRERMNREWPSGSLKMRLFEPGKMSRVWESVYEIVCMKLQFHVILAFPTSSIVLKKKSAALPFSCPKFSFKSYGYICRIFFLLSKWANACTKQMHGGLTDGWMDWHSLPWMSLDTLINFGLSHISLALVLFFFMASHLYQITYLSRAGIWVSDLGFRPLGWDLDLKTGM